MIKTRCVEFTILCIFIMFFTAKGKKKFLVHIKLILTHKKKANTSKKNVKDIFYFLLLFPGKHQM